MYMRSTHPEYWSASQPGVCVRSRALRRERTICCVCVFKGEKIMRIAVAAAMLSLLVAASGVCVRE